MPDARQSSASAARKRPRNILGTIVGYLLVIFLLFFLMLVFGRVSGTEVSADSMTRRNYTFFQIPLLRIQCTPVWRSSANDRVATTISQEGYLLPNASTNRWDVIEVHVGGAMERGKAENPRSLLESVRGKRAGGGLGILDLGQSATCQSPLAYRPSCRDFGSLRGFCPSCFKRPNRSQILTS